MSYFRLFTLFVVQLMGLSSGHIAIMVVLIIVHLLGCLSFGLFSGVDLYYM